MWTLIRRLRDDEHGFTLITGMLILMVITLTSITVVQLSQHNANESAYDRNRTQAINAAEAGIDDYLSAMPAATLPQTCAPLSKDLPTTPPSHYDVTIKIYSAWPPTDATLMSCPPSTQPQAALIRSAGTAVASGVAPTATRTMQAEARLQPAFGGFNMAIFSDTGINLVNHLTANGDVSNDADVYTNGNFSMNNNSTIAGSIFAQGTITITNGATINQDVWGNGAVNISGSTNVFGQVKSSTSSVTLANGVHVYGAVRAGTTITNSGTIDGAQISNSPQGAPPYLGLPHLGYDDAYWTALGYTPVPFSSCALAQAFIDNMPVGNYVVRISPECALSWANNENVTVNGNLGIVTDGSVTFQNHTTWTAVGGNHNVFFIRPWQSGLDCSSGNYNINFSNNTDFEDITVGVYTQCTANMANQNLQYGQVIGGTVNINNQMNFTYSPILFPGSEQVGFDVRISYLREIANNG